MLSGRGTFRMGEEREAEEFGPGHLLFFRRGTVHALPTILEEPLVFLSIDAPQRDPADVVFVDPTAGTPESLIRARG